jgi:hypothetical protein
MGTVHQLRWDRPRGRPLARMPRKFLARRSDALLFVGVFIVAAAIGRLLSVNRHRPHARCPSGVLSSPARAKAQFSDSTPLVSKGDVACTSHGKDRYGRQLRNALTQDGFLGFGVAQPLDPLQRDRHVLRVFAQKGYAGLIGAAPHHTCPVRPLLLRDGQIELIGMTAALVNATLAPAGEILRT